MVIPQRKRDWQRNSNGTTYEPEYTDSYARKITMTSNNPSDE